jgi:endonuclease/exonuclease/phosphatase (EEP) superfamily protein YafD
VSGIDISYKSTESLRNSARRGSRLHLTILPVTSAVLYILSLHVWRTNHVLKILGAALLPTSGLAIAAAPQALALQAIVTQVDKNANGTAT